MAFNFIEGEILVIEKPLRWTSYDLIRKLKSILKYQLGFKKLKIGHAGTLDPLASGLMIVCTGKATKRINEFQDATKEYIASIKLGATTPSFDLESAVDQTYPTEHITQDLIKTTLQKFIGEILQVPPIFSAVKIDGKRAYELARKGQDVELKAKPLRIDEIEILNCEIPDIKIRIVCSKGTYIRAFARDLGIALNSGAYLSGLIRTRVGEFTLENAYKIEDLENKIKNISQNM